MRIFFALVLCIGVISCEEEPDSNMAGKWKATWQTGNELLTGEMEFRGPEVFLKAYGKEGSMLLPSYSEMRYTWSVSGNKLVLDPADSDIRLEYDILTSEPDKLELQYLDDIRLSIERVRQY